MNKKKDWIDKLSLQLYGTVHRFDDLQALLREGVTPLVELLQESKKKHRHRARGSFEDCCEACWCDPVGECDCGAAEWNEKVEAVLAGRKIDG